MFVQSSFQKKQHQIKQFSFSTLLWVSWFYIWCAGFQLMGLVDEDEHIFWKESIYTFLPSFTLRCDTVLYICPLAFAPNHSLGRVQCCSSWFSFPLKGNLLQFLQLSVIHTHTHYYYVGCSYLKMAKTANNKLIVCVSHPILEMLVLRYSYMCDVGLGKFII